MTETGTAFGWIGLICVIFIAIYALVFPALNANNPKPTPTPTVTTTITE